MNFLLAALASLITFLTLIVVKPQLNLPTSSLLPQSTTPTLMTPTPQPTPAVNSISPSIQPTPTQPLSTNWIYPGSQVQKHEGDSIVLISSDNPQTISTWYKDQVKQQQFPSVATASSSANGQTAITISASKGNENIKISIEKPVSTSVATITLIL